MSVGSTSNERMGSLLLKDEPWMAPQMRALFPRALADQACVKLIPPLLPPSLPRSREGGTGEIPRVPGGRGDLERRASWAAAGAGTGPESTVFWTRHSSPGPSSRILEAVWPDHVMPLSLEDAHTATWLPCLIRPCLGPGSRLALPRHAPFQHARSGCQSSDAVLA